MKDSGVEWIGEIPKEWNTIRLKYLLTNKKNSIKVGPFGSQIKGNDFVDEGVPVYTQRTVLDDDFINGDAFITKEKYSLLKGFEVEPLDFLITTRGSIGRVAIAPEDVRPGIIHPCIIKFTIDRNIYNEHLLKYIFNGSDIILEQLVLASNATTIPVVYSEPLKNVIIPIAPYNQQQKIVRYLNEECTKIDAVIKKQQAIIEKLKEYKLSIITEAVTGVLTEGAAKVNSGISYVDYMPDTWKNKKMLSILAMRVIDGPHESPALFDEGVPYISATAIVNGRIDFSKMRGYISEEYCDICDLRYKPQRDDILVIKLGASTGQVAMVDTDQRFNIWVPLAAVRCNSEAVPKFVYYAFQSDYFIRQMEQSWTYGTQQTLGVKTIERLRILLPPISEQKRIVKYLDLKCEKVKSLIDEYSQMIDKLNEYKSAIIYETVTGKEVI